MTDSYPIHGRVVRVANPESNSISFTFELIFPEDWHIIDRQLKLKQSNQDFAQLHIDTLRMDALDDIDESILKPTVRNARVNIHEAMEPAS